MIKQPKFVRCSGRKNLTLAVLSMALILHLIALLSGLVLLFSVKRSVDNSISIKKFANVTWELYSALFLYEAIAHIILFCCFIVWLYCAYRNHHIINRKNYIIQDGYFLSFFSPLVMVIRWLVLPYELVSEIWQGNNYNEQTIEPLAFGWWLTLIVCSYYGKISDKIWLQLGELPQLYGSATLPVAIVSTLFVDMLWILSLVLWIKLVTGIHARQNKAYEAG